MRAARLLVLVCVCRLLCVRSCARTSHGLCLCASSSVRVFKLVSEGGRYMSVRVPSAGRVRVCTTASVRLRLFFIRTTHNQLRLRPPGYRALPNRALLASLFAHAHIPSRNRPTDRAPFRPPCVLSHNAFIHASNRPSLELCQRELYHSRLFC